MSIRGERAPSIAVWHPRRMIRTGLVVALADGIRRAVCEVEDPAGLIRVCEHRTVDVAVVGLGEDDATWNAIRAVAAKVRVVGLYRRMDEGAARQSFDAGVRALVYEGDGMDAVRDAVDPPSLLLGESLKSNDGHVMQLDDMERALLFLVAAGRSAVAIASELGQTVHQVDTTKHHLYRKLGVQNQTQAVSVALRLGLLKDN